MIRSLHGWAAGDHVLRPDGMARFGPGIYLVRLRQGREVRECKAVVVR